MPGPSRSSPCSDRRWDDEVEAAARSADYRERAVAYRAIAQFRFRQKIELLRRGLEDESPACRGSALLSLEQLSRDHPGVVNGVRPLLHELVDERRQRRRAAAGDRRAAERVAAAGHDRDPDRARRATTSRAVSCARPRRRSPRCSAAKRAPRVSAGAAGGGAGSRSPRSVRRSGRRAGGAAPRAACFARPARVISQPAAAASVTAVSGFVPMFVSISRSDVAIRRRAAPRPGCAASHADAPGSTTPAGGDRIRACRARSSRGRRARASPARCAGRRRPRADGSRRSGAGGADGRDSGSSPAAAASRRRIRKAPERVSGPPRAFRKTSLR